MFIKCFIICIIQVPLVVCMCNDSHNAVACSQWGLSDGNECIINPEYVACFCNVSCESLQNCSGPAVTNDTDCLCRRYALYGDMESDPTTYAALCPTTYYRRIVSNVQCLGSVPNTIFNAVVDDTTLKAVYRYMDRVQYDCVAGYKHRGYFKPTMTCDYDGNWFWGFQTGNMSCDILITEPLEEISDFEPGVKEATGAAILGTFGIFIIIGVVGCIIGLDCMSCKKHLRLGKRNTRHFGKWLRQKRNGSTTTNSPEPSIDSTELNSINDSITPVNDPSCPNKKDENVPTSKTIKLQLNPQKLPTLINGKLMVRNDRQFNGVGASVTPKGGAAVAPSNKKVGVKTTSKYTKTPIRKPVAKPKPFVMKTKTSVV